MTWTSTTSLPGSCSIWGACCSVPEDARVTETHAGFGWRIWHGRRGRRTTIMVAMRSKGAAPAGLSDSQRRGGHRVARTFARIAEVDCRDDYRSGHAVAGSKKLIGFTGVEPEYRRASPPRATLGRGNRRPVHVVQASIVTSGPAPASPGHREKRTHESWISMGRRGGARGGPLGHRPRDERGAATGAGAHRRSSKGMAARRRRAAGPRAPRRHRAGPAGPGGGSGRRAFPAQQRPKGDPEVIQRGRGLFAGACGPCHGADARGGQLGGPNLLRSELALNDKAGELMFPVIKNGRPGTHMVAHRRCPTPTSGPSSRSCTTCRPRSAARAIRRRARKSNSTSSSATPRPARRTSARDARSCHSADAAT